MASEIARQLDELMGRNRNATHGEELLWSADEICKHFLSGFCPNDLFSNTKSDLGPCSKVHDESLREQYQKSDERYTRGYETAFLSFLQSITDEVDRKVKRSYQRLNLTQAPAASVETHPMAEQIKALDEKIADMISSMEKLGEEGKVDEAQALDELLQSAKRERAGLLAAERQKPTHQEQPMLQVCDVCGALLSVAEAQSRVDAHLEGKQHQGYHRIRNAIKELKDELDKRGVTVRSRGAGERRDSDRGGYSDRRDSRDSRSRYDDRRYDDRHRDRYDDRRRDHRYDERRRDRYDDRHEDRRRGDRYDDRRQHRSRSPHERRDRDQHRDRDQDRDR